MIHPLLMTYIITVVINMFLIFLVHSTGDLEASYKKSVEEMDEKDRDRVPSLTTASLVFVLLGPITLLLLVFTGGKK